MPSGERKQKTEANLDFAKLCMETFYEACGVGISLFSEDGAAIFSIEGGKPICPFCPVKNEKCAALHAKAGRESERFGGRYIYCCPCGLVFFASPVLSGGVYSGPLVGGPLLIVEADDLMTETGAGGGGDLTEGAMSRLLGETGIESPSRVKALSHLLFMVAAHISGEEYRRLAANEEAGRQQAYISGYIQELKNAGSPPYPFEKEAELLAAIEAGNKPLASSLLNEILGHIFFSSGGRYEVIRARVLELLVLLSRAAVNGGADVEEIFGLNHRYLTELDRTRNIEELTLWLSNVVSRYIDIVFGVGDVKHADVIYRALAFIKRCYMKKIMLEDVAMHVYLSPAYFSKIFRQEMGCTFVQYLNIVRIDKSKALLLSGDDDIVTICEKVGFEDQSYFSKVFKKITGTTPGRFRESRGSIRLDTRAEKA